jgi:hypothetical protein
MVNETDVKNNKLSSTEDRGSRSVWNDGIHPSTYTESHTGRQKTLRLLVALCTILATLKGLQKKILL